MTTRLASASLVVDALHPVTDLPLDVHLMIVEPDQRVPDFIKDGADIVSVHCEQASTIHLHRAVNQIKSLGAKAGVVLNPGTPLSEIEYVLDVVDLVLIMSENPGFGGQSFIESQVKKISDLRKLCAEKITAFSDRHPEFEKINTEILGVSVDSVFSHLAWVQTDRKSGGLGDLNYPLVSDVTKSISESYGVLIRDQGVSLCGLFIIDKEGIIQHSTINNLAIGRSVDETMKTLQALELY